MTPLPDDPEAARWAHAAGLADARREAHDKAGALGSVSVHADLLDLLIREAGESVRAIRDRIRETRGATC